MLNTFAPFRLFVVTLAAVVAVTLFAADAEWRPLFNGRDLENFTQQGNARWRVEEGIIVGGQEGDPKRSGTLATKDLFADFELELEFMIDEHGKYNSGVYLRNAPGIGGRSGYQINIGRAESEEYIGLYTDKWLSKGDDGKNLRKKLEWNKLYIYAKGAHIKARLNGVEIVELTDPMPAERFLRPGTLAFQTYGAEGHAGWVKYRNLRVRELK